MNNDPQHDDWLETYKSFVTLSTEGFKFCALANGGAAVAILAYLGNVVGKGFTPPDMSFPMVMFLTGLVLCGTAMLFAYFNQLNRLNRLSKNEDQSKDWRFRIAIALIILSLASFAWGSWQAVFVFKQFTPSLSVESSCLTDTELGSLHQDWHKYNSRNVPINGPEVKTKTVHVISDAWKIIEQLDDKSGNYEWGWEVTIKSEVMDQFFEIGSIEYILYDKDNFEVARDSLEIANWHTIKWDNGSLGILQKYGEIKTYRQASIISKLKALRAYNSKYIVTLK